MIFSLPTKCIVLAFTALFISQTIYGQKVKPKPAEPVLEIGSKIIRINKVINYPDNRPPTKFYVNANDAGIIFRHGMGPDSCDAFGARNAWVWENNRTFYLHYDGAGPKGWLSCLAVSEDFQNWKTKGPILATGNEETTDFASASFGTTYQEKNIWHLFYLGTPNASPAPDHVPSFPFVTLKAVSNSPAGPWKKNDDVTPLQPKPETFYAAAASPGPILKSGNTYLMFFSASTENPSLRTIGIARTKNLDSTWTLDANPILPSTEQIEHASFYFEASSKTWFLFTNHIGIKNGLEYTDAVWVYWSKSLDKWNPKDKAIVFDSKNCKWSKHIIGAPSVLKVDNKLVILYDGNRSATLPSGIKSQMNRDIGMAWLSLPLLTPTP